MLRIFSNRKKDMARIFFLCLISISIITTILFFMKTNETSSLEESFDTYGKYTVRIEEDDLASYYEKLAEEPKVKDSFTCYKKEFAIDENNYTHLFADSKIIDFTSISLVDGSFPTKDNEILIERNYLFHMGISKDEMVGSKVVLPIDDKGNVKEFIVKGVIVENTAIISGYVNDSLIVVFPENDLEPNQLLIQVTNLLDYKEIVDYIVEKYNIDEDVCYINFDLFLVWGFLEEGSNALKQNAILYYFLYTIILLCTIVSIYNFIKLMVYNSYSDIAILNLLGISKKVIVASLFILVLLIVLVSAFLGILVGIGASNFIFLKLLNNTGIASIIIDDFPYKPLAVSIIIYIFVVALIMLPIIIQIQKLSPNLLMQTKIKQPKKSKKSLRKHLFKHKSKFFTYKLAKNNIKSNKSSFNISVFALACSILVFVFGFFFLFANSQIFGHETKMDYKVSFPDEFTVSREEIKKQEALYSMLEGKDVLCSVYPIYIGNLDADLKRDALSRQYIKYLQQSVEDRMALYQGNSDNVQLRIVILGYNDLQLQELYKKNGMDYKQILGDNEIIALNKTLPTRNVDGFKLNFQSGDYISMNLDSETANLPKEFIIKDVVDELETYPKAEANRICFIINENTYKKWMNINRPDEFYIKIDSVNDNTREEIEELLIGDPNINIFFPEEEEAMLNASIRLLRTFITVFFIIIIFSSAISISSTLHIRIYTRETEYAMMNAIGISHKQLKEIVYCELFTTISRSIIVAGVLSYAGTYLMQVLMLGTVGRYMYEFPFPTFVFSCLITIVALFLMSIPILNRLKNMDTVMILKKDT